MTAYLSDNNINMFWASLIVEELIRNGVTQFCIAPGSRSTPLALAAADHPQTNIKVHYDERGLSYFAIGYTSGSRKPACLITTSGTAVANCFPAVIEASKKKIPLIVLTGDRPPELRLTGANQTIDQIKFFGDYVRYFFDMPCPDANIDPRVVLTTIDQAVYRACNLPAGPVHLNCMLREPLAPLKTKTSIPAAPSAWKKGSAPLTTYVFPTKNISNENLQALATRLDNVKSGVIAVGKLASDQQRKAVVKIAERLNWPIFPDITSGLRTGVSHPLVIPYFDHVLLNAKSSETFYVDGILQIGGRMTSGRYSKFIDNAKLNEYIMILNHPLRNDPSHNVSMRIEADIGQISAGLIKKLPQRQNQTKNQRLFKQNDQIHSHLDKFFTSSQTINQPAIARIISKLIPRNHALFLGSSLPVREMDTYASPLGATIPISSNRGASGIDGNLASAMGYANGLQKPVTLLSGDLTFLHDLNSLAMLRESPFPLTIVLINNNGGGIFSFLDIANYPGHFEQVFGTPHHQTFASAAELFGLEYIPIETLDDFAKMYSVAAKGKSSTLIEVTTDRNENAQLQKSWQQQIHKLMKWK